MPDDFWGNDMLGEPEFKLWMQSQGRGGRGRGAPGFGPGGGYGSFFGMPGIAPQGATNGVRQIRRRIGFQPMLGASQPSAPTSIDSQQTSPGSAMRAPGQSFSSYGGMRGMMMGGRGAGGGASGGQQQTSGGGNANWNDPAWWAQWGANNDSGWGGLQAWLLSQGYGAGAFNPLGSPQLVEAQRQRVLSDAGAREAKARTAAALAGGGDPSMRGVGELLASLGTASDASRAGSDAALSTATSAQDFIRSMLADYLTANQGAFSSAWAGRNSQSGGNDWLDQLLGIGGQALGGWLGRKRD